MTLLLKDLFGCLDQLLSSVRPLFCRGFFLLLLISDQLVAVTVVYCGALPAYIESIIGIFAYLATISHHSLVIYIHNITVTMCSVVYSRLFIASHDI